MIVYVVVHVGGSYQPIIGVYESYVSAHSEAVSYASRTSMGHVCICRGLLGAKFDQDVSSSVVEVFDAGTTEHK